MRCLFGSALVRPLCARLCNGLEGVNNTAT